MKIGRIPFKLSRTDAQKGDPVPVPGVNVCVNL